MLPKQKTTFAEKNAPINKDIDGDYNWFHQTADHYINQFGYDNQLEEVKSLQNAVEGLIDTGDYKTLLNPFNMDSTKNYKVGATLRNHNILKGVVYLMLGEYGRRTHDYSVTSINPDDDNKYKEGLRKTMQDYYEQETINALNEEGVPTGQPSKEQGSPEQVEEGYKTGYDQQRVIFGQNAIDYIRQNNDIDDKIIETYYDWITVGAGYTYRAIRNNDVFFEHVPVEEIYAPIESHSPFVEDGSFAVRHRVITLATVLDEFGEHLSEKDLDRLETEYYNDSGFFMSNKTQKAGDRGFMRLPTIDASCDGYVDNYKNYNGISVYHIQWKSFEKYGILTYTDEFGEITTIEVDDEYKLNYDLGDLSIEWKWDTCVCEVVRIADDIYCLGRIVEESRGRLGERGGKKLSYNGIRQRSKSGTLQSIVKEGIPYQLLINGLHYQLEKIINKNKDKIIVMPYGLIPRKKGMDTKETLYHADATSILWVDETAPNASLASQMIKVLDTGLGNYISDVYGLITSIKQEYWDAIGMNAQRYSDVASNAGKGVTEQAIIRSAIITYDLNRKMDKLTQKDYAACLDLSKLAWRDGKKSKYLLTDGSEAFLELNADEALYHAESEYSVFVRDSTELSESTQLIKGAITQAAQQSGALEAIAEVSYNNNPEKLKSILGRIEDNNKKHEIVLAETQGKQQQELQKQIEATREADREVERYKADKQLEGIIYSSDKKTESNSRNEARPDSPVEQMMANHTINKDISKDRQANITLEQRNKELELKNKDLEIKKSKANGK